VAGCLIGSTALFTASGQAQTPDPLGAATASAGLTGFVSDRERAEAQITRSFERSAPAAATAPQASPTPVPTPARTVPAEPVPVAGLIQLQMNNAATIVKVGQQLGLPRRALIIGIATAMQESNLYNTASTAVPESFDYPHEGQSSDHDSVGLFQQRPSQGWGSVADLMRPAYQADRFFTKLMQVDWENMALTYAAQAVQVSAYPEAYAKHESRATTIVDALMV
jgi:hypothetical protein